MARGIILHITNRYSKDKNKEIYYDTGIVEVRSPQWALLETRNLGRELTMLDMENMFFKIYEDETPKSKARKLRKLAKAAGKQVDEKVGTPLGDEYDIPAPKKEEEKDRPRTRLRDEITEDVSSEHNPEGNPEENEEDYLEEDYDGISA